MNRKSNNQVITKSKGLGSIPQIVIGCVPIMVFWICSLILGVSYDNYLLSADTEGEYIFLSKIFDCFSMIAPFCICAMFLIISIISKRYDFDKMYNSTIVSTCLPVGAYILMSLFTSDSNIIAYILLPVWIILFPFGKMCSACIDNAGRSFDTDSEWICVVIVISIIVSLIVHKICKTKNLVEEGDFIYD